jgi:hypothetical protein
MKHILVIFILTILSIPLKASWAESYDDIIESDIDDFELMLAQNFIYNSERGYWFPTKGTYRMLVIFVNIIYDVTPNLDPKLGRDWGQSWGWNVRDEEGINQHATSLTEYFSSIFDVDDTLPRRGFFTRLISEASFDSLVILGDFTSVEIRQSRIQATGGSFNEFRLMNSVIRHINSEGGLILCTDTIVSKIMTTQRIIIERPML